MKQEYLIWMFENHKAIELAFPGRCCDCGKDTTVKARLNFDGVKYSDHPSDKDDSESVILPDDDKGIPIDISGGAVYGSQEPHKVKCEKCFEADPHCGGKTEVYSRVVGYLRPIKNWNNGQQAQFNNRKMMKLE